MPKYTINKNGKTVKFNSDRELNESELNQAVSQYFGSAPSLAVPQNNTVKPDATSQTAMPKPQQESGMGIFEALKRTVPIQGTNVPSIISAPTAEKGAYAKTMIGTGLPFMASAVTNPMMAIGSAGALGATAEALGTKVSDLITGERTPDVVQNSLITGLLTASGEGLGRGLVSGMVKAKAPFKQGYQPEVDALAGKYGIELPASASTTNRAVPLLESLAGKSAFGNKLTQMTMKAEKQLTDVADDFVKGIDASPDASIAGVKSAEGMKKFEDTFRSAKNELYSLAKIKKGDLKVSPKETVKLLDEMIADMKNSAIPNTSAIKEFQKIKSGLAKGDELRTQLAKQGFNEKTIEKIMSQQKVESGVDGTTVLNTIRDLKRKVNFNSTDPVATGYQAELRKIGATLDDEFDTALGTARPDLAEALAKANATYKDGIQKLNSTYGKKIERYSKAGQYDKIAEAVLNKNTSVDDIPKIFEVVGEEGKQALKADLAKRIVGETKRNAKDVFTPSSLDKTLKQFGEARLKAIYTPEEFQSLQDLSKLTYALGQAQRVSEGSQTTFTAKMSGVIALAFSNPILALKFLASDAVVAKVLSSKTGQQLLRGGFEVSNATKFGIPATTRTMANSLSR